PRHLLVPRIPSQAADEHGNRVRTVGHRAPDFASVPGCGTMRRYGFGAFQPSGNFFFASSSFTLEAMITSSPCFQFTGVATAYLAVSWRESMTRRISSKLRPVLAG